MVLRHVGAIPNTRQNISSVTPVQNYSRPLAIVTTLFFMWGFLTCLNDILIPHLKSIFELSYAKAMLIQFAFFSAYFLFSVSVVEGREHHRVQNNHGGGFADHGSWSILVRARRICCFLPTVSDCTACSRSRDYRSCRFRPIPMWIC